MLEGLWDYPWQKYAKLIWSTPLQRIHVSNKNYKGTFMGGDGQRRARHTKHASVLNQRNQVLKIYFPWRNYLKYSRMKHVTTATKRKKRYLCFTPCSLVLRCGTDSHSKACPNANSAVLKTTSTWVIFRKWLLSTTQKSLRNKKTPPQRHGWREIKTFSTTAQPQLSSLKMIAIKRLRAADFTSGF